MKRLLSWCGASLAALILSGCAGNQLERTVGLTPTGSEFNRAMFTEYLNLSRTEFNEGDYGNSDKFAVRAQSSAANTTVQPEEVSARRIPADKVSELTTARGRLVNALNAGARERLPRDAAHAQAMFDCWMEEQEENFQPDDIAACRGGFLDALARIEVTPAAAPAPAQAPGAFIVFFDWNRSDLTADARRILDQLVARERAGNQGIRLIGHADRSGAETYNMQLSQRRADSVKAYLVANGVAANRITTEARGERDPLVQTADGVREPQNRRVAVTLARAPGS
jgi:OOP family OmpA-OmpF porin